jgi:transcriptional regulator with XRE-family HTH domain
MATEIAIKKRLESRRKEVAERVVQCLKTRGLKPLEFAKISGIKPSFISRVLSAEANLTLQTITKLELALDYELIQISNSTMRITEQRSGMIGQTERVDL